MEFLKEIVGFLEVNCYIIPSQKDGCVYIIDPGASPVNVANSAKSCGFDDYKIILTHAHIDHVSAVKELMEILPVSLLYLHEGDMTLYNSPANELQPLMPAVDNPPQPVNSIENCEFRIIHTPGHTRGGVCFYFEEGKSLFSGDTLFCTSIGRTDLPGGNTETLLSSIKDNLLTLPGDTVVYPGHGPSTTIAQEKSSNPFL
jgi:glyoxylase-like metal-dependent hydrolase (beta-lactamase superfamily II)